MLSCMRSLYILDINPVLDIFFAVIFSHSVCGFSLCWWFPSLHKAFYFDVVAFVNFCFFSLVWGDIFKKVLQRSMSKIVLPMFSSRSFMVSGLTFKSLMHQVYFCTWCERVFRFDTFACNCPVFPTPFIKEAVFSPIVYSSLLCCRLTAHVSFGSFLGCLFCFIDPGVCFCASTILFWWL